MHHSDKCRGLLAGSWDGPPQRPMRPRGASGARSQACTSAPTSVPRELVVVLFFMKSTRPCGGSGRIQRSAVILAGCCILVYTVFSIYSWLAYGVRSMSATFLLATSIQLPFCAW